MVRKVGGNRRGTCAHGAGLIAGIALLLLHCNMCYCVATFIGRGRCAYLLKLRSIDESGIDRQPIATANGLSKSIPWRATTAHRQNGLLSRQGCSENRNGNKKRG